MWKYYGVIKNKKLLLEDLSIIEIIKNKLNYLDLRIDKYDYEDHGLNFD